MGHPRLNFFYNLLYSRWLSFGEERKRWLSLGQPFPQILLCPINCLVERFTLAQVAMSYHIYGPLPKATWANNMSWPFSNNQTIPPNNLGQPFLIWWKIDPFLQAIIWITHEITPHQVCRKFCCSDWFWWKNTIDSNFGWRMDLMLV